MAEKTDIVIIGGGVIGCALAYELSDNYNVFLLEKNQYLGDEQSGRNSGVNHAGIYYKPDSLKAKLCVEGNHLLSEFCKEHMIPYKRVGKIIVPTDDEQVDKIEQLYHNASSSGAEVSIIYKDDIKNIEPNVNATIALYSPNTGIIDVPSYIQCLAALAENKGASILTDTEVTGIEKLVSGFEIETNTRGTCNTDIIINAAGLYADLIAKMVNQDNNYTVELVRGEYCLYEPRRQEIIINGNIYPVPEENSIGVHLTPTFDKRKILVGPYIRQIKKRNNYENNRLPLHAFIDKIHKFFPSLQVDDIALDYCGIMVKLPSQPDFLITRDKKYNNCIHMLGINSPGLSASLAIAQYVREML